METHLESWTEEKQSAFLYQVMAEVEKGSPRERLFRELSIAADRQADIWASKMKQTGQTIPSGYQPPIRAKVVASLIRTIGPQAMKPVLAAMKVRGISVYDKSSHAQYHAKPTAAGETEKRHKASGAGGNLRATVFGANDGLVSNASLIFGIAGASDNPSFIMISGVAGLLAGAFSMAAGEYISVRSQRELFEYQINLEREELELYPEEEAEELALIYEAKGIPYEEGKLMAERLLKDPEKALDTLAREELGLNPDELGSPIGAALFSFTSFSIGAFVPLLPFLMHELSWKLPLAMGLTGTALFTIGAVLSLFSGRSAFLGGFRMLALGGSAGIATFFIGKLLGVSVS